MWFLRLVIALIMTVVVPVAGYLLSDHITASVNMGLAAVGLPPFDVFCASPQAGSRVDLRIMCVELATLPLLHKLSAGAAILGAGIPATLMLTSIVVGKNRRLLAAIFPAIVQFALMMIVLSVLMQGAVLTLGSFVAQEFFLHRVRIYIVIAIGAGAAAASWKLFDGILEFGAKLRNTVSGMRVSAEKAPELHEFVNGLAEKLGAQPPRNIVVGLEPNFFVTSAEVVTPESGRPLEGATLYISAPLARLMTMGEFAAVIGHELGHFRGADTAYSLKFAPVYAGLANMLAGTKYEKGERFYHGLAKLPARAMLHFMMTMFAINERAIGRQRELLADKAGAEASSPEALATALVKVVLYAGLWESVLAENVDRLNQGKATRNLSNLLEDRVRYDVEHTDIRKVIAAVVKRSIPHPTDTHPAVGRRMKSLGVDPASIDDTALRIPEHSAIELFGNATALEENLSTMEHKRMVDFGFVPEGVRGTGGVGRHLSAIYRIAVPMIVAEGRVKPEVIRAAEVVGTELFPGFDPTDFRQACRYAEDIPDMEVLIENLNELLDQTQKKAVIAWLGRVAGAMGEIGLGEALYIDSVATDLGFGQTG